MTPATIRNRAAIPALVRRALRRLVATVAVAQYVADRVRAVMAAKRARLLARCAACSNVGPMRTNYRAEGLAVSVERKARAA